MADGRILGAVLAGGLSTRFGSDKAVAMLDGERLIDHAVTALARQCDAVIVVGREYGDHGTAPDWPRPHMGPLGGIAGALAHAREQGFATVLTCGVDSINLPADLARRLSPAPACLEAQPVIGHWPVHALDTLKEILLADGKHSVRRFAEAVGARTVAIDHPPANINFPDDLTRATKGPRD